MSSRPAPEGLRVGLRPSTEADKPFLHRVYAASRQAELELVPWDQATKDAFLLSQAQAQDADYRLRRPNARFLVVTVDGEDAGRLYRVELPDGELRLMDIALLPKWRGRGVGTRLLEELVLETDRRQLVLTLHVEHHNRVRRLYDRLGFVVAARDEVNCRMERRPQRDG